MMEESNCSPKWEPPVAIVVGIWVFIVLAVVCLVILHKNNYDKSIAGPMVAGLVTIVVGASAAYFGTKSALRAAQQTHLNNLALRKQDREAQVRGVIQAIYAELSSLSDIYRNEFQEEWEKFVKGEPFTTFYPISQDYFTVYNGNAALIGQIPDDELRTGVVRAYLASKGLVDSHLFNNRLLDDYAYAQRIYRNNMNPQNKELLNDTFDELKGYSDALQSSFTEANAAVGHVLNLIEASGLAPNVVKTS
jgi:hypothetical protein